MITQTTHNKLPEELDHSLEKYFREATERGETIVISSLGRYKLTPIGEDKLTDDQLDFLHEEGQTTLREGTGVVYTKADIDRLRDDL